MKGIALILSFCILWFSFQPCSDVWTAMEEMGIHTTHCDHSGDAAHHDHGHSHSEEGHCSPFCGCACHGSFFTWSAPFHLELKTYHSIPAAAYSLLFISAAYLDEIWQPPRFS